MSVMEWHWVVPLLVGCRVCVLVMWMVYLGESRGCLYSVLGLLCWWAGCVMEVGVMVLGRSVSIVRFVGG